MTPFWTTTPWIVACHHAGRLEILNWSTITLLSDLIQIASSQVCSQEWNEYIFVRPPCWRSILRLNWLGKPRFWNHYEEHYMPTSLNWYDSWNEKFVTQRPSWNSQQFAFLRFLFFVFLNLKFRDHKSIFLKSKQNLMRGLLLCFWNNK